MRIICLLVIMCGCSQKTYTSSLVDQRKKHTQKITSKDVKNTRLVMFTCIALGIYIHSIFVKD